MRRRKAWAHRPPGAFWSARISSTASRNISGWPRSRWPTCTTCGNSRADVELLATVDAAHESLSGPATRRILQRAYQQYDQPEYQRLASISVAHLYNLRQQPRYRQRRLNYVKTKPTGVTIGERRRPDPQGQPGYLRVDTVHQGDRPTAKGVYHINAVDEVTQWQIVAATAHTSAKPGWSRCWSPCCGSFLSASAAFTPITAASSSTRAWPSCSTRSEERRVGKECRSRW